MYILVFIFSFILFYNIFKSLGFIKSLNKINSRLSELENRKVIIEKEDIIYKKDFKERIYEFVYSIILGVTSKNDTLKDKINKKNEEIKRLLYKIHGDKVTFKQFQMKRIYNTFIFLIIATVFYLLSRNIRGFIFFLCFAIGYYFLEYFNLKSKAKEIDWINYTLLPNILTSIAMLYQTGGVSNIFLAFEKISKIYDNRITEEFKKSIEEYNTGMDKIQVLKKLSERIDIPDFASFINVIIENEKNGIPIYNTLIEYAYNITTMEKIEAIGKVKALPFKMELVMLLTMLPIIFLVMILPMIYNILIYK